TDSAGTTPSARQYDWHGLVGTAGPGLGRRNSTAGSDGSMIRPSPPVCAARSASRLSVPALRQEFWPRRRVAASAAPPAATRAAARPRTPPSSAPVRGSLPLSSPSALSSSPPSPLSPSSPPRPSSSPPLPPSSPPLSPSSSPL